MSMNSLALRPICNIFFFGDYSYPTGGNTFCHAVSIGHVVSLQTKDGQDFSVEVTEVDGDDFKGIVTSAPTLSDSELSNGVTLAFREEHIFSCAEN